MNVFVISVVGILITMALALTRAFLGPTVFDRVLAANMFGTKTVLLIAVAGFLDRSARMARPSNSLRLDELHRNDRAPSLQ